jgi:hypothetical protein
MIRVLFIGNSYTFFNEMPRMLEQLAASGNKRVQTRHETSGGKNLEWHWHNSAAVPLIDEGGWDYVVLQDHSIQTIAAPEKFEKYTFRFAERIKAAGARPILYMTWARQHLPEDAEVITSAYLDAAKRTGSLVAPAGLAWKAMLEDDTDLVLHTPDRSHPNFLGSYLVACTFFATIFQTSPKELTWEFEHSPGVKAAVDIELAKKVQGVVWETVEKLPGN